MKSKALGSVMASGAQLQPKKVDLNSQEVQRRIKHVVEAQNEAAQRKVVDQNKLNSVVRF